MTHLLLAVADKSPMIGLFGKLHPAVVHFPIALISVAALFELLQMMRKRPEPAAGTLPLVALGAVSAVVASLFGWALEEYDGIEGSTFDLHKWVGIGATVVAVTSALISLKAKSSPGALLGMRLTLLLGAALVGGTGYLGGELVFGENHIFGVFKKKEAAAPPANGTPTSNGEKPLLTPSARVSFEKEIAPIIKDMCFKCHGGAKIKGKFKLNTKVLAMEGGGSGKAILPGKPSISSFYTSLVAAPDTDQYMPPAEEKVRPSKEQIEKVKLWIEQGAEWPDGFEFKK